MLKTAEELNLAVSNYEETLLAHYPSTRSSSGVSGAFTHREGEIGGVRALHGLVPIVFNGL